MDYMDSIKNRWKSNHNYECVIVPIKVAMNVLDIATHLYSKIIPTLSPLDNLIHIDKKKLIKKIKTVLL